MPTLEEVEIQAAPFNLPEGMINYLPSVLEDGEVIEQVAMGYYKESGFSHISGHLMVTDRRFIYSLYVKPGTSYTDYFYFSELKSITVRTSKNLADYRDVILIDVADQKFVIERILTIGNHDFFTHIEPLLDSSN
ncbi:hypothetical protein SPD48_05010 [Pseudogracilibacillus sp. SE30717A]|uniref:hypothetical protein n=1 Tax=Pseudogracilibacillus sp. SE30717A TaxID=3098293 RepID=UPI00300DC848